MIRCWRGLIMLAAATVFLITTSLLIFNDHHLVQSRRSGSSGVARDLPADWRGQITAFARLL